jgi:heptosyltransferase III
MYGDYPDLSNVKKILVVKLRQLGDVLLISGFLDFLKKSLPEATLDVYIYREALPILEGNLAISRFFLWDRSRKRRGIARLWEEWKFLRAIRKEGYDLVINLTEGDRGALAARWSGARYRIGPAEKKNGFFLKNKIYTHLVKKTQFPRHTVEKHFDYARRLGLFPSLEERALSFFIPKEAHERVIELTHNKHSYILIHPTSRWRFKCLPSITMGQLIEALDRQGYCVVLSSGPDKEELEMIDSILKNCAAPILNLSGKLKLKELASLVQRARALICVDSLVLHLASTFKTPVVALFGPTSEENWGPWQHPFSRIVTFQTPCRPCFLDGCGGSKVSDCLTRISAAQILENLQSLL